MCAECWDVQSSILKAMAHPTRLSILQVLRQGERCVCEIAAELQLEQPNVSQHLSILKQQGLIQSRKRGLWVFYGPATPRVFELLDGLTELVRERTRAAVLALE